MGGSGAADRRPRGGEASSAFLAISEGTRVESRNFVGPREYGHLTVATSHAQYDVALEEQATHSIQRDAELRTQAAQRSRVRRRQRVHRRGTFRFVALCLTILATTLIVAFTMFQVLALVAG